MFTWFTQATKRKPISALTSRARAYSASASSSRPSSVWNSPKSTEMLAMPTRWWMRSYSASASR